MSAVQPLMGIVALASLVGLSGCTKHWNLKVTEVGKRQVELYMDEAAADSLDLSGQVLTWTAHEGPGLQVVNQVDLGVFGQRMAGGTFIMIFEESGYPGPPVAASFLGGQSGPVPGIKVADNFFRLSDAAPSEVRLAGERTQSLFPIFAVHKTNDVVRFGSPQADRPATGGDFAPDGSLGNPSGSASLQRRWSGSQPQDTDRESNWFRPIIGTSWGVPTP